MKSTYRRRMPAKRSLRFAVFAVAGSIVLTMSGCSTFWPWTWFRHQPSAPAATATPATPAPPTAAGLDAAIGSSLRSDRAKARDVYRHPRETLQFFGLQPTQTVLEIAPGAGWYTDILAPYLSDMGRLYEAEYISPSAELNAAEHATDMAYQQKLADNPDDYGRVVVGTLRDGRFTGIQDQQFDLILTFRNIHNWIKDGQVDANLRAFYRTLKHGGTLGVEEHRARPGTSLQQMIDTGYVTERFVIEHAQAAGFVLAARSEVNANPRDTKDYPHGVWSLPPSYAGGDEDRERLAAIGESDRMTLRFIKR